MGNSLDRALDAMSNNVSGLSSYEESFDESLGYYDTAEGHYISTMPARNAPSMLGGGGAMVKVVRGGANHPGIGEDKATFDILVTRLTNNIALPLSVAIFGTTHAEGSYFNFLQPPAGGTFTVIGGRNSAQVDRYRFTFTVGAGVDIIDVFCNQVPYPTFIDALGADIFRINNIRVQLSDQTSVIQFSQLMTISSKSLFGSRVDKDVTVSSYKAPTQFQPTILDIPISATFDKETAIIMAMTNAATAYPFTVTLSTFVQRFKKMSMQPIRR